MTQARCAMAADFRKRPTDAGSYHWDLLDWG